MGVVIRSSLEERREAFGLLRQGYSQSQVARRLERSKQWVSKQVVRVGGVLPRERPTSEGPSRFLTREERYQLWLMRENKRPMAEIARVLKRDRAGLYREMARNTDPVTGQYQPEYAHTQAVLRARRPQPRKLVISPLLRFVVQSMLNAGLSPEQVAGRLRAWFPDDQQMHISHETIYQGIYVRPAPTLARLLRADLRTRRVQRRPRGRAHHGSRIPGLVSIHQRPEEVQTRLVPGHHEGDLVMGSTTSNSAVATILERTSGYLTLIGLPQGHTSAQVIAAIEERMRAYPALFTRSLTWDRGTEMTRHQDLTAFDLGVFFADPYSPWQRGSNENVNGLLREYLPKGSDLSVHDATDLARIQDKLNHRPRKRLNYLTPHEAYTNILAGREPTDREALEAALRAVL